jgi:hypothetical protein
MTSVSDSAPSSWTKARRLRRALRKHWAAKILSLLLAIAIWFLVRGLQQAESHPTRPVPRAMTR